MLPPPALQSKWAIKKVVEVKRKLGCAFIGLEARVEDFFWEIDIRRSQSPRKPTGYFERQKGGMKKGELKNLKSDINYDNECRGRSRRKGRRHSPNCVTRDEADNLCLEY